MVFKKEKISEEENKKLEYVATIAIIVFAITSYIVTNFILKKNSNEINIYLNDQKISSINGQKIDLGKNQTFTIGDINSDYNTIEILDNKIRCIDSNCPDKICVSHGFLNKDVDNDMIVCAPHGLIISYK